MNFSLTIVCVQFLFFVYTIRLLVVEIKDSVNQAQKLVPGMFPGNAVLGHRYQLDSCQGFGEIMQLDTVLLDLNATEMIDILDRQHANQGLGAHLRDKFW